MIKTSTRQKILLFMFSLILTAIILKTGFGEYVLLSAQKSNNLLIGNVVQSDNKVYKILTLGESTTAGTWNSWPTQLEIILNNKS